MGKIKHGKDVFNVLDTQYKSNLLEMKAIAAKETRLRSQLSRLDASQATVFSTSANSLHAPSIGADICWKTWVEARRAEFLQQLALVLVHKDRALRELSLASGRRQAAKELMHQSETEHRKMVGRHQSDQLNQMVVVVSKPLKKQTPKG